MRNILSEISKSFYDKIVNSPHFSVFFIGAENFDLKNSLSDFMEDQLTCTPGPDSFRRSYKLGAMHAAKGIPLNNVLYFMDYIQTMLFEYCKNNPDSCKDFQLTNLDNIRNNFAKGYLHESIRDLDAISIPLFSVFSTTRIATSILNWMTNVNNEILRETLYEKTSIRNNSCDLVNYLNLPFFNMIFENQDNFFQFNKMHFDLHNTVSSMFYFIDERNFVQTYYIYTDFVEQCKSFMNYYFERVVLFEQNKENYFYKFASDKIEGGRRVTLFTFNIRNMQLINKVWGHDNGDFLVNEVQRIIDKKHGMISKHSVFIKTDSAEFIVLLINQDDVSSIKEFEDLVYSLKHSLPVRGEFNSDYKISSAFLPLGDLSAVFNPHLKLLVKQAVEASKLNDTKPLICTPEILNKLNENVMNEEKVRHFIRQSFNRDSFTPFYQTIVNAETGEIAHMEALARVCDGESCVSAGSFIDYLITTDRIIELDKVILEKIRKDLDQIKLRSNTVFINISPKSLRSPTFVEILKTFIEDIKISGVKPVFEITEQSLFDNVEFVRDLHQKHGSIFAIDDFGSGYSNFSIVSEMAQEGLIKYLKIDGTLIKGIHLNIYKANIVAGIIGIAKSLNLYTIAEFVSDSDTSDKVKELGVSHMQGFHYSVPSPITKIGTK